MDSHDKDVEIVKRHIAELGEFFDSVRVFVTRHEEDGGTVGVSRGAGNWYSQRGQVEEWLSQQDELTRLNERKED